MQKLSILFLSLSSFLSLTISTNASGGSSTNQLIGTVLIGLGVFMIIGVVLYALNSLKTPSGGESGGRKKDVVDVLNQVPEPEVAPPVDILDSKPSGGSTINMPMNPIETKADVDVKMSSGPELPNKNLDINNLPNVPLSELTNKDLETDQTKTVTLQDIQSGKN